MVPPDMLEDLQKAKIVITNYHSFKLRERAQVSKGGRQLLQGRKGEVLNTQETEGQMLQRVMPELMGMKNDEVIPHQERINELGDQADLESIYVTERQLLYVACTRARDQLLITSGGHPSEFLADMR